LGFDISLKFGITKPSLRDPKSGLTGRKGAVVGSLVETISIGGVNTTKLDEWNVDVTKDVESSGHGTAKDGASTSRNAG